VEEEIEEITDADDFHRVETRTMRERNIALEVLNSVEEALRQIGTITDEEEIIHYNNTSSLYWMIGESNNQEMDVIVDEFIRGIRERGFRFRSVGAIADRTDIPMETVLSIMESNPDVFHRSQSGERWEYLGEQ
jgi:hypothetical protein